MAMPYRAVSVAYAGAEQIRETPASATFRRKTGILQAGMKRDRERRNPH